jgi:formate dehydrogenase major subunit
MSATIDGRSVEPALGETIFEAARRLGIAIPTLCRARGTRPEGACRLCMVEIARDAELRAACHTELAPGMRVATRSERLDGLRREILELVLEEAGQPPFRPDPHGNELERAMSALGVSASPEAGAALGRAVDASHPYLRFDRAACIACRRCVHACDEVQGQFVYAVEGRGAGTRIVFGTGETFAASGCVACGACVDVCPTGAVSDRDRASGTAPERTVRSTCGYCGVGCQLEIGAAGDRVVRVDGARAASVNRGHLCVKGRYAHGFHASPDRLTSPLLRQGDRWEPVSWEEAIAFAARRLHEIHRSHGPDALGAMTSSRSTNEAAYLLQKLFRTRFATNHVDCCARVCHASTAEALREVTGTGAASACYDDIECAQLIVVAGANPTEAHPVIGARIKQRALAGVPLVVIDPRRIELADHADVHLSLRPGTNVPLLNALARVILDARAEDRDFLAERCEGAAELAAFLATQGLESAARASGVPAERIRAAGRLLAAAGPVLFVHGLGLSELTQGTESVMALANLAMLTGSIGRPGAGLLPLRGQNNVQGNADMGGAPTHLPGYQPVDDDAARRRVADVWGTPPPATEGKTIPEMLEAAQAGTLRALWIQGEDVAQSDPNEHAVRAALGRLELLIVQELFLSETAHYAHLVLPAAAALEQDGTFTNAERRIQRVRAAVPPPGEARPDWRAVQDVAHALGCTWDYGGPADVMDEIARVAPALFGGVAYDRLEGDGLQWPCPSRHHSGTPRMHVTGFVRGRGRLSVVRHRPSPEADVEGYPLTLVTGRVLDHYNVGTMTRRTPNVVLAPRDRLALHPADASALGLAEGDRAAVASRWGSAEAVVHRTDRVARGTCFLTFHFPDTHANALTGPQRDPLSDCPEYKVTAVRVTRAVAFQENAR